MANIKRITKKRLGEILVQEGLVDKETVTRALAKQKTSGKLLGRILIEDEVLSEEQIAKTLVQQFGIPFLRGDLYRISDRVKNMFPLPMLKKYDFVPLDIIGKVIIILTAGIPDSEFFVQMEKISGCNVHLFIGTLSEVKQIINDKFGEVAETELSTIGQMLLGSEEEKE
mgnify:CR=1 FL=1